MALALFARRSESSIDVAIALLQEQLLHKIEAFVKIMSLAGPNDALYRARLMPQTYF